MGVTPHTKQLTLFSSGSPSRRSVSWKEPLEASESSLAARQGLLPALEHVLPWLTPGNLHRQVPQRGWVTCPGCVAIFRTSLSMAKQLRVQHNVFKRSITARRFQVVLRAKCTFLR